MSAGKPSRLTMVSLLRHNFKQFSKKQRPLTRSRMSDHQQKLLRERLGLKMERGPPEEEDIVEEASSSRDSLVFASLGLVPREQLEHYRQLQQSGKLKKREEAKQELGTIVAEPSQQREFCCRFCGKGYRWKSTMRRHESLECGDKPPSFQCPQCPYKARQRGNLTVHFKRHHQDLQDS